MSKKFREKFGVEMEVVTSSDMRSYCSRPGRTDGDGKPIYRTEQHHKNECDVNRIIKKYDKTGVIHHVSKFEAEFGDATGPDFKSAMDLVVRSQANFDQLPSNIRKRFKNSAGELLAFMDDASNREEAIELGLIDRRWTPESDGLGEHVKLGENVEKEVTPGNLPADHT